MHSPAPDTKVRVCISDNSGQVRPIKESVYKLVNSGCSIKTKNAVTEEHGTKVNVILL